MRVALITGATGGLGRELAKRLDAEGFRIIIHYFTSEKKAKALSSTLNNHPCLIRSDISDFKKTAGMAQQIEGDIGRLDIIINNAGITKDLPLMSYPLSTWNKIIDTNLKGTFNCVRHLTPLMINSGGGHIINISSYSGLHGKAGQVAYSASKAGITGFTISAARELSGYGIFVNAVVPGYLPVGMGAAAKKAMGEAMAGSMTGALSSPENVAAFISCLVGTRGITGQVFTLESRV